jgi:hypothetical protein
MRRTLLYALVKRSLVLFAVSCAFSVACWPAPMADEPVLLITSIASSKRVRASRSSEPFFTPSAVRSPAWTSSSVWRSASLADAADDSSSSAASASVRREKEAKSWRRCEPSNATFDHTISSALRREEPIFFASLESTAVPNELFS